MSEPLELEARPDPTNGCTVVHARFHGTDNLVMEVSHPAGSSVVTIERGNKAGEIAARCETCRTPSCPHREACFRAIGRHDVLRAWALANQKTASRIAKSHGSEAAPAARSTTVDPADRATQQVAAWLSRLQETNDATQDIAVSKRPRSTKVALFTCVPSSDGEQLFVSARIASVRRDGKYSAARQVQLGSRSTSGQGDLTPEDLGLITALRRRVNDEINDAELTADDLPLLVKLLETGRAFYREQEGRPLRLGDARRGAAQWVVEPTGKQAPRIAIEGGGVPLWLSTPQYFDAANSLIGPLTLPMSATLARAFVAGPSIAPEVVPKLGDAHREHFTKLQLPQPRHLTVQRQMAGAPVVRLTLVTQLLEVRYAGDPFPLDFARVHFDYPDHQVPANHPAEQLVEVNDERVTYWTRNRASEDAAKEHLRKLGFKAMAGILPADVSHPARHRLGAALAEMWGLAAGGRMAEADAWLKFVETACPELRQQGWRIDIDPSFRWSFVTATSWFGAVAQAGNGWFDLSIGVDLGNERIDLLPILIQMLREHGGEMPRDLATSKAKQFTLLLPDHRKVKVDAARMRTILAALVEMQVGSKLDGDKLQLRDAAVAQVAALEEHIESVDWKEAANLRKLATKLREFEKVERVAAPAGLNASLRPYQLDGLAWLQFLRAHELGGILADDMGLGKTLQALAHVLVEKRAGRLDRPCLVVAPTSVVHNWANEAAKFTPMLRVLVVHGDARASSFEKLGEVDLVLTTYPLIHRDLEKLKAQPFHLLMLDEAQAIKNARAKVAKALRELDARHRLCLTGTPLENNLTELWAQLDFLMPGLLGDAGTFGRVFRGPIEKLGDGQRRAALAKRIRPFVLRRTKQNVAAELPAKTEVLQPVELSAAQRDLYETIRLSVHERVRQTIAEKGIERAQIVILDALLKLRQVCCDPRLVKLDAAKDVTASAKLQALLELLDGLLADGRRVLLFSQFTSMLALIEAELQARGIAFAKLTGDTKNRKDPVEQFQSGKVKVFLISLKAGGTGLNLTTADTVIHYDPWWNPAAEQQATDRAHRIGQDKPVFVYKLIAAGTVEEKIAGLQERKRALAAGVLDDSDRQGVALTKADVDALFAAIEE